MLNIDVSMTDVKGGLIVNHEGTITELQDAVGGEDGVVGLSYSCGNLGGWVRENSSLDILP